jgi:hypothetical protein
MESNESVNNVEFETLAETVAVALNPPAPISSPITIPAALLRNEDRTPDHLKKLVAVLIAWLAFTWTRIIMENDVVHSPQSIDFAETPYYTSATNETETDSNQGSYGNRLLYIVTTSTEYNSGKRAIVIGEDRLMGVVVPVIQDSVQSMIAKGYEVDVFLVLAYNLTQEREKLLLSLLPVGTGLEVWNDALPFDYDARGRGAKAIPHDYTSEIKRALARQHRYVVKDKFFHYDIFVAFEDDMRITGGHVDYFLEVNAELDRLKREAPDKLPRHVIKNQRNDDLFFGPMTKQQLKRFKPGFMRVEVLSDEFKFPTQHQRDFAPLQIDLNFTDMGTNMSSLDPTICCHTSLVGLPGVPRTPNSSQIMLWETAIQGFTLREMPPSSHLGWVGLMAGPMYPKAEEISGKYWGDNTPANQANPRLLAQSAGWMMTKRELLEFHAELCEGAFLPPFDLPTFGHDGLYQNNVEYWSGGIQMWCRKNGCNIQRIVSLDPANFSKHLLYHSTNNKQQSVARSRLVKANHLLGQLNTLRKSGTVDKLKIIDAGSNSATK